ncbi:transmembrane protein 47-like isoform X2 [Lineus longissimus]|uniref:transmembrane protein 47-like isoform X2 n=1 Tax=Lineus longissimus TaxID=88925 RepID=UPI002B4C8BBE
MSAPTTTIETINVVRPLKPRNPMAIKVIALVCGIITVLLTIVSIASTEWLSAEGYREGLWQECLWDDPEKIECRKNPQKAWIQACGAFAVIALLLAFGGTIMTGVGLFTKKHQYKFKLYRVAMFIMFFAVLSMIICLVVFPIMFLNEIQQRGKKSWLFAWAYGMAWGATIFCFGAAILLLLDKESEEIYYKEKINYPSSESTT